MLSLVITVLAEKPAALFHTQPVETPGSKERKEAITVLCPYVSSRLYFIPVYDHHYIHFLQIMSIMYYIITLRIQALSLVESHDLLEDRCIT
jgi:hypothetical protein